MVAARSQSTGTTLVRCHFIFKRFQRLGFCFGKFFVWFCFWGFFAVLLHPCVGRGVIFSELHRIKTQPFTSTSMPGLISPTGYGDRPPTRKIAWPLKDDTPESCCTSHTLLRSSDPLNTTNTTNHQTHTLSPTPTKSKRLSSSSSTQGPKCLFPPDPTRTWSCWSGEPSAVQKYSLRRRDLVSH